MFDVDAVEIKALNDEGNQGYGPRISLSQSYYSNGEITIQDLWNQRGQIQPKTIELTEDGKTWLAIVLPVAVGNGSAEKYVAEKK